MRSRARASTTHYLLCWTPLHQIVIRFPMRRIGGEEYPPALDKSCTTCFFYLNISYLRYTPK